MSTLDELYDDVAQVRVVVAGRVQGVGFRNFVQRRAQALGVSGWVRNRGDSRVEAVFQGDKEAVRQAIAWCRTGPPGGHVTDVEISYEAPTGKFNGFSIRW